MQTETQTARKRATKIHIKTRHDYWNVVGAQFLALYLCLEDQYTQLSKSVEEMVERIRALGSTLLGRWQRASSTPSFVSIRGNIRRHRICSPVSEWTMRR